MAGGKCFGAESTLLLLDAVAGPSLRLMLPAVPLLACDGTDARSLIASTRAKHCSQMATGPFLPAEGPQEGQTHTCAAGSCTPSAEDGVA